ncbi:MAG: LacI family DNA-binding transcriptional regulator [Anaerolineae bacterium]|nr:LacI family DNA-binding transcriptional regulator [Anaerolineae bacterium]
MPTIHDVAERAGVSPITVSRVINSSGPVSEKTRARVEAAIAEMNYVPNQLAQGLRSKRIKILGLLVTDITNPFFTTIARGAEDVASEAGYSVVFCNTDESVEKERKYLQLLVQQQVAGILLVPARSEPAAIDFVQSHNVQVVVLDRQVPGIEVDAVRCDSVGGAHQLVSHLLELGHRRIALLNGPHGVSTADDRLAGYEHAMHEFGIHDYSDLVYSGSFSFVSGYQMAQQVLATKPMPTALFAANNFIANGALNALHEHNLSVPDDMAMVCFDELPASMASFPVLTTIAQPAYALGQEAARLLIARLSGEAPGQRQEIILPTTLIVRASRTSLLDRNDLCRLSEGAGMIQT